MPTLIPSLVHLSLQSSWGIDQVKALIKLSIDLSIKLSHQSSLFVNQVESLINLSCQLSWVANQAELSIELSFQSSWVVNWVEHWVINQINPTLHEGMPYCPPTLSKISIRYCILRDPNWLTIPIYPYFWHFFCFRPKDDLEFRVSFLRQGSKSKNLNFKKTSWKA